VQHLARLAPRAIRHHQQQRLIGFAISLHRLRIISGKQQPRLIPRPVQQRRQILEYFTNNQLGINQPQCR
jgi:hypothetical protein